MSRNIDCTYLPKEAEKRGFPDVETMLNYIPDDDGSWEAGGNVYVENCEYCGLKPEYCRCENY